MPEFDIHGTQDTPKGSDRDIEKALRPLAFDDFSGQDKIVDNLRVFVQAARMRGEALDHTLLH
ncbi:MAG: Holliday junction branch migration DNA helicase RuvB, partial [Muribaculaceae bacterium]|nr:Holliday junction branch migration DNA helicase RuvB [Muribaculaceae bacterium]